MSAAPASAAPTHDCALCPRLAAFRAANQDAYPDFHNGPVPSFGSAEARLLIVGLAPGLKGANRTARPFTGDYAGDLLYPTLVRFGFARGDYGREPDDGLTLVDCRITNAVRCVPPENKPIGAEIRTCRSFLIDEMRSMPHLKAILALGTVSHGSVLSALGCRKSLYPFGHGALHEVSNSPLLVDSYHCSRYNTNTGRLTEAMFADVFTLLRNKLG